MIIKALILSSFLTSEPAIVSAPPDKIEAKRRNGKGNKKRRLGGNGLR